MPLWKNVLTSLPNMSAVNAAIQKKPYGSDTAALIISNEEMEDIIKVTKLLGESGLLIKGISETIQNKTKEQKMRISSSVIGNISC